MTTTGRQGSLNAFNGDGVEAAPDPITGFVTLSIDDHYFPISVEEGYLASVQIITDGTIAGTFTIETSNLPKQRGRTGPLDTSDFNEAVGRWIKEDPAPAYVASVGTGWTWTLLTGVKTAGVAGAITHLGNLGSARCRLKASITTGGTVRVAGNGKQ